jgi:hypothetical protein
MPCQDLTVHVKVVKQEFAAPVALELASKRERTETR